MRPHRSRPIRRRLAALALAAAAVLGPALGAPAAAAASAMVPLPALDAAGNLQAPPRTQISIIYTPLGIRLGTANQHESRPGLSIVKLFIGQYVVEQGSPAEIPEVTRMIRASDDAVATRLYRRHPESIAAIAARYRLGDTVAGARWGASRTSAYDMATFLDALERRDPTGPVLTAMRHADTIAADGYPQNFGTATLPGVTGTKFGWSDDRVSCHASASIGTGFVVGAATWGTASTHTADVRAAFPGGVDAVRGLPGAIAAGSDGAGPGLPEPPAAPGIPGIPGIPGAPVALRR